MTRVLVAGPPAAGKTTYAQRLAARLGAEVIDLDLIANRLGSPGHDHPKRIREDADREVERRIDAAAGPVVVVRSVPESDARRRLAERMRADRVVVLAAPAEVARQRAVSDGRPSWTGEVIDRWWSRYSPDPTDEVLTPTSSGEWAAQGADMSKQTTDDTNESTQDGNEPGGSTSDAGTDTFTPPSSQEELDRIIAKRIERERSKYADYDDLRKRAARLDEIEAEQMSEVERAQKRADEAEAAAEAARTEMLRFRVASQYGIAAEDAELFLTAGDEETLAVQARRLQERTESSINRAGAVSPREGRIGKEPTPTPEEQFGEWAEAQFTRL